MRRRHGRVERRRLHPALDDHILDRCGVNQGRVWRERRSGIDHWRRGFDLDLDEVGQILCLLLTLLVTPVVYSYFDDLREWSPAASVKRLVGRGPRKPATAEARHG